MDKIKIEITRRQANIILRALENEAVDDIRDWNEYSYGRCYNDIKKKIDKAIKESK